MMALPSSSQAKVSKKSIGKIRPGSKTKSIQRYDRAIFLSPGIEDFIDSTNVSIKMIESDTFLTTSLILYDRFLSKNVISDISKIETSVIEFRDGDSVIYCESFDVKLLEYNYSMGGSISDDRLHVSVKFKIISSKKENSIQQYMITENRKNRLNEIL